MTQLTLLLALYSAIIAWMTSKSFCNVEPSYLAHYRRLPIKRRARVWGRVYWLNWRDTSRTIIEEMWHG